MWIFLLLASCTLQSTTDNNSSNTMGKDEKKVSEPLVEPQEQVSPRIIILGDSITAGMGLDVSLAYPALLEKDLQTLGYPTEILNAGQSGDTTAGGLRRVDWLLKQQPDLLIVELGANDGMRGIAIEEIEGNLNGIIDKIQEKDIPVFLADMYIPSNFGKDYTNDFHQLFAKIAQEQDIPLLPFPLEEVAGRPELNQSDGIHPTAAGHQRMAEVLLPDLKNWREKWTPSTISTAH